MRLRSASQVFTSAHETDHLSLFPLSRGNAIYQRFPNPREREEGGGEGMMRKSVVVTAVLVGFLFCGSLLRATADVVTLNADTFADKVKEKDTIWFIKFCVPWCKHCKNLGSLWEDLEKDVEGEDGIEIGQVDCTTSKPICTKVDIHSYPTFKLFYEGEEIAKYKGPRDVGALKVFALEEADKAAKGEYDSEKSSL